LAHEITLVEVDHPDSQRSTRRRARSRSWRRIRAPPEENLGSPTSIQPSSRSISRRWLQDARAPHAEGRSISNLCSAACRRDSSRSLAGSLGKRMRSRLRGSITRGCCLAAVR
jgi:hypothetical protein